MNKWDKRYLDLAKQVSAWSKDPSTQTGAVIVRPDKSIAAVGFNGFPRKMPDFNRLYEDRTEKYSRIIHCEMNALEFCRDQSMEGYTLYTYPFLSCDRCYVHMLQAGITRFVAPKCHAELEARWGDAFDRVRSYASESHGIVISELDYE